MDTSEQDMHNIVIFTGTHARNACGRNVYIMDDVVWWMKNISQLYFLLSWVLFLSLPLFSSEYSLSSLSSATIERMISLALYRKQLYSYLEEKMATVAPNLSALIGETVAARLIQKAGSLTSLAKCPASTVQILGAEKALFRALKTKGNTPKYGLIYHSSFIGRASAKNKGRISRYLSNKCAIASRIDSFIEEPTSAYGESM